MGACVVLDAGAGRRVGTVERLEGCAEGQKGGGPSSGGGGASSGGQLTGVTPPGVVTERVPSSVMTNRQFLAWVFSRWWRRHRQQRFSQAVGPPQACGTTWSASAQPALFAQPGKRQPRSRVRTNT